MTVTLPPSLLVLVALAVLITGWALRAHLRKRREAAQPLGLWGRIEIAVGTFLVVAMVLATGTQILARYLLFEWLDLTWTEEFARLAMVWAALWGAAILQRRNDHIALDVVVDAMPKPAQRVLQVFADGVALAVLGFVCWYGWLMTMRLNFLQTAALGVPISVFGSAVAVCSTIMVIHTATNLLRRLAGREPQRHPAEGV